MSNKKPLLNIDSARVPLQKENMERIQKDGVCPFCTEHLAKYHTPPIIKTGTHWIVTSNMYPYENTAHHILFISKKHLTSSSKLSSAAWTEIQGLLRWLMRTRGIKNGTFLMRSGDMQATGASVSHLHAQFIVGSDPLKPVVTRVG